MDLENDFYSIAKLLKTEMAEIKHILYVIDSLQTGGAEKSLLDIAIHNKGAKSTFVTIYKGDQLKRIAVENNIDVIQFDLPGKYAFKKAAKLLIDTINRVKPDLVHSTLFRSDIIARKIKRQSNIPLISSLVNNSYISDRYKKLSLAGKMKLFAIQYMDRLSARKVDYFISNSQTIMNSNAKALGLPLSKISVIFRGRDFEKFQAIRDTDVQALKRELGIHDGDRVLLNVSRLLSRKGQLDLLKAFHKLSEKNNHLHLLIAGEGAYRNELQEYIDSNNLTEKIRLLGNRDDIPILLALADVFVFPTHYEGLPGALIEAMMSGKTIVCSNIPENRECATDNEVVFFEKGNISDLVIRIELVLSSMRDYSKLGETARSEAYKKFSINSIVSQYNVIYQEVISNFRK